MKDQKKTKKVSLFKCLSIFDRIDMPWGALFFALIFMIFSAWAGLVTVTFAGDAVDASGAIPAAELAKYILANVGSLVLLVIGGIAGNMANVRIQYLLRNKLWNKIVAVKQKSYDRDGGESLVSRVTSDCDFSGKFFDALFNIIKILISVVMYLLQLYLINQKITGWVLALIPVSVILGGGYAVIRFYVFLRVQAKLSDATAYLTERTKDLNLIKTCNAQQQELEKGRKYFREQYNAQLKVGVSSLLTTVISTILETFGKVIPFAVGAVLVANGEITVGALVTINTLFGNIINVFAQVILQASGFKEANGALSRVALFFDEEEEDRKGGTVMQKESSEDLIFDQVQFGYTDRTILKNLSCRIPKNKVTAVVGTNGSGKSTMFKLLTRLYEPNQGAVRFGEKDASEYNLDSWRKKVCLIAQGAPMMAGTIRENICYGRTDTVPEEELIRVAKLSHVYDFVKDLPDGFDSEVTAGGGNFSGGQRQCIAIARAMMSQADYLLLDESTSNLDVKREKDVMEAMAELMKGRTTVIIAHSLSAIKDADHVIILNQGVLEAEGAPAKIIEQTGNYLEKMMKRRGTARAAQG